MTLRYGIARVYASRLVKADDGFTIDPNTGEEQCDTGYAVAIDPDRNRQAYGFLTGMELLRYVEDNRDAFLYPSKFLGAWYDGETNIIHLDVVTVLTNREDAEALARANGEIAIWDFEAETSIRV